MQLLLQLLLSLPIQFLRRKICYTFRSYSVFRCRFGPYLVHIRQQMNNNAGYTSRVEITRQDELDHFYLQTPRLRALTLPTKRNKWKLQLLNWSGFVNDVENIISDNMNSNLCEVSVHKAYGGAFSKLSKLFVSVRYVEHNVAEVETCCDDGACVYQNFQMIRDVEITKWFGFICTSISQLFSS